MSPVDQMIARQVVRDRQRRLRNLTLACVAAVALVWLATQGPSDAAIAGSALLPVARPRRRCPGCGGPVDALGSCIGICAGEDWER